jgi:hypothetical protein
MWDSTPISLSLSHLTICEAVKFGVDQAFVASPPASDVDILPCGDSVHAGLPRIYSAGCIQKPVQCVGGYVLEPWYFHPVMYPRLPPAPAFEPYGHAEVGLRYSGRSTPSSSLKSPLQTLSVADRRQYCPCLGTIYDVLDLSNRFPVASGEDSILQSEMPQFFFHEPQQAFFSHGHFLLLVIICRSLCSSLSPGLCTNLDLLSGLENLVVERA